MTTRVSVFAKCVCLTILGCITAVPAQAGLMHNMGTTPSQEYIDYANSGRFDNVIPLEVLIGDSWFFNGTAVAIADDVILFSAHQALPNDSDKGTLYDGFSVSFTSNFFEPGPNYFDAIDVVVHPDFQGVRNGPDLALAFFEAGSFSVAPMTLYSGAHVPGTPYDFAGFGQYGTPATGLQGYDGNRRAGTNFLTAVDSPEGYLTAYFERPGSAAFHPLGILGTPGDSGGAVLLNGQLAGIMSDWGGRPGYEVLTYATYFTDADAAWINSEIATHAVPEPSSLAILMSMGMGLLGMRRSSKTS